jgi:hypothetical protein
MQFPDSGVCVWLKAENCTAVGIPAGHRAGAAQVEAGKLLPDIYNLSSGVYIWQLTGKMTAVQ